MKMDVIRVFTNISVLLILGIFTKGMPVKNWFEAQAYCANRNETLTRDSFSMHGSSYWTARYQRISHWIKLIGCFEEKNVIKQAAINVTMEDGSAGYCQEICLKLKKSIFAIKKSTCLCLRNRVTGGERKASSCKFTCPNNIDTKFTMECGGDTTYNVYGSMKEIICDDSSFPAGVCLATQCIANSSNYMYFCSACSTINRGFCQHAGTSHSTDQIFTSWEEYMTNCKENHNSYLLGNLPLSSALNACTIIDEYLESPTWIGIAKQRYQGLDQGYTIGPGERSMFIKCEKCQNNQCSFMECTNTENIDIYCSATNVSTVIYHPSSITTTLVLGIVIPIIVILLGTTIGGALYFWRRRKQQKIRSNAPKKPESELTEKKRENIYHEENDVQNSSYFTLEPKSSYEQFADKITQAENPYNEAKEGDYDHLGSSDHRRKATDNHDYDDATCRKHESRNKESKEGDYDHLENNDSRRKVTDETYCHTSSKQLDDCSDYDVANHTEKHDLESTYDHASTGVRSPNDSNYDYSELKEI